MDVLLGTFAATLKAVVIWYVLQAIARWKLFGKMGEAGWKGFIPLYSDYILFRDCWDAVYFWVMLALAVLASIVESTGRMDWLVSLLGLASCILTIGALYKIARAFGRGIGFTLGLIFFNPIFLLILGFGQDEYLGPQ